MVIRLAAALALAVTGPIWSGPHDLHGAAIRAYVPVGWYGQACAASGLGAAPEPVIRLATIRPRSSCADEFAHSTQASLGKGDILILVEQQSVSKQSRHFFLKRPLAVTGVAKHVLEGTIAPAQAYSRRSVNGRYFLVVVYFGAHNPAASTLAAANGLLARVRIP